jgi:hypothetical protein
MPGEIENIARSMMSTPQGLKIIKLLDQYNSAMNTEPGHQLIVMLGGAGGNALKEAAAIASKAPKDHGKALLSTLLSSKDGAALAAKIIEVIGL